MATTRTLDTSATMTNPAQARASTGRLLSLDVLRGITICFMIMVNNNGGRGSWWFMNHAEWNGLTPTDLVFPTFLFVVGITTVLSIEARLSRGATRAQLAWHTISRAAILFCFGLIVNGFPTFALAHYRIYGVLQRIAICYLIVGLFYLWDRGIGTKIAALVACLVGYWILVRWVPVPGAGVPTRDIPLLDPNQNIVAWLDRHIFPYHLYEDWTTHNTRDPEGLLSDIPSVATALIGVLTAFWLRSQRAVGQKTRGLFVFCVASLGLGNLWALWLPLNKKMWTSSYVLVAAGFSLLVLALAYWAVEQLGVGKGKANWAVYPWLVFGSNAIVAYMFSEIVPDGLEHIQFTADGKHTNVIAWLYSHVYAHIPDPGWSTFAYSVTVALVCFIPVWILYRRKLFLKV
jgi:predicted acyltransferase